MRMRPVAAGVPSVWLRWACPLLELQVYKMGDDLVVRLRGKARAIGFELLTQSTVVFDDAVVDDGNAAAGMRVRVRLVLDVR